MQGSERMDGRQYGRQETRRVEIRKHGSQRKRVRVNAPENAPEEQAEQYTLLTRPCLPSVRKASDETSERRVHPRQVQHLIVRKVWRTDRKQEDEREGSLGILAWFASLPCPEIAFFARCSDEIYCQDSAYRRRTREASARGATTPHGQLKSQVFTVTPA